MPSIAWRCECARKGAELCETCGLCGACCECSVVPIRPADLDDEARLTLLSTYQTHQATLSDLARSWLAQVRAAG